MTKIRMGRFTRDCIPAAAALLLVCPPSATAQLGCEYWAGIFNGREAIERLNECLEAGADVNAPDRLGSTPLHAAARVGRHAGLIEALVNAGADVHARRSDGSTPLHVAAEWGRSPQVVEALVAAGADVNARDNVGNTPLHRFRGGSHPAVARQLLELGADPLARNDQGRIAYPASCENWNTWSFTTMASASEAAACVAEGRDVNARDDHGGTPLHHAIEFNAPRLADLLLASGADPDIADHQGASPLHRAVLYGPERVQPLLNAGADINLRDGSGATPLHAAQGNADVLGPLLAAGADARAVDDWGRSTLHAAAIRSDSGAIVSLAAAGADPRVRDLRGRTALHEAAERGYSASSIVALVTAGASVNARDAAGNTPLHLAWSRAAEARGARIVRGHRNIVERLLALGADPAARNDRGQLPNPAHCENWNTVSFTRAAAVPVFADCLASGREVNERNGAGDTPVLLAVSEWKTDVSTMLLEEGADPNGRNLQGLSPLHLAANDLRGDTVLTALLLASGADPNLRDNSGGTPLHRAVRLQDPGIAQLLLRAGAELDARDSQGQTPLQWAMNRGRMNGPVIEALGEAGADLRVVDLNGESPLHRAVALQDRRLITRLLELGADPNAGGGGRTALHRAAWGPASLTRQLLEAGADPSARTVDGWTPLHSAAAARDPGSLTALLDAGADVNVRAGNGETPLHRAARSRVLPNVAALLEGGADANARTAGGDTPLHFVVGLIDVWTTRPPGADHLAGLFGQDSAIVAALILAGADVNARNNGGDTPLRLARESRRARLADALVGFGAEADAADTGANVPEALVCNWSSAVFSAAPVESIRACIDAGADVNTTGTTLHTLVTELRWNHALAADLVRVFLQAGADPNARGRDGATPLHLASAALLFRTDANRGQSAVVAALREGGADPNARDEAGATPLHHIARGRLDNAAAAALLLGAGADPNARDLDGETPLHAALTHFNPRMADRLLDYGADPGGANNREFVGPPRPGDAPGVADCEDWPGTNLFRTATADVVLRCIEGGVDVMSALPHDPVSWRPEPTRLYSRGATPLHVAAGWTRDPEVITLLVDAGGDVNARDPRGYTPLHRAARDNASPAVIGALVEAGADPMAWTAGAQNEYLARGVTPLHEAAANENPAIAARLLEAGANVNASGAGGRTPLHVAAAENANPAVATVLLAAGADVHARRAGGRTPLHEAAAHGTAAVVAVLLAAGADAGAWGREDPVAGPRRRFGEARALATAINVWGGYTEPLPMAGTRTPLHEAAAVNSDPAVILALIEAGADVHAPADLDRQYESAATPIYWAAAANPNPAIIEVLAAAGADVNAAAGSGRTPLHIAAQQNPVVFPTLLRLRADPAAVDRNGKTPMDYAAENAWLEILEVVRGTGR